MSETVSIGEVPWTEDDLRAGLEEFARLYAERPIKKNRGGMTSTHLFSIWFALRAIKPRAIVESGVWKGQGTWLFETTCPDAQLYCIEPRPERIIYRSEKAVYHEDDFSTHNWDFLPRDETVFFFDDHQNAYERLKTCLWFGFRQHIFFDDNYPPLRGDCYSLKKVLMNSGFGVREKSFGGVRLRARVEDRVTQAMVATGLKTRKIIRPNAVDSAYLRENLALYYEFPPLFKRETTRWGDPWDAENYPTREPLLRSAENDDQRRFLSEADHYTWLCYVKLR